MSLPFESLTETDKRRRQLEEARAWGTHGATRCPMCKGSGKRPPAIQGLLGDGRMQKCGTCRGKGKI